MLDELKMRLNRYIDEEGVAQKHISKQIKINETSLSKFKTGKIKLDVLDAKTLDEYLRSKGY